MVRPHLRCSSAGRDRGLATEVATEVTKRGSLMSKSNDKKPKSKIKQNGASAYKTAQSVDTRTPSPIGKKQDLRPGRKGT